MRSVVLESKWVESSAEQMYLWAVTGWAASARDYAFAENKEVNPFFLDFEQPWVVRAQKIKLNLPRVVHEKFRGMSQFTVTPSITHVGRTSLSMDHEFRFKEEGDPLNGAVFAKVQAVIVCTNEFGESMPFPFDERARKKENWDKSIENWDDISPPENKPENLNDLLFQHNVMVRPCDIDGMEHLHSANYIFYVWDAFYFSFKDKVPFILQTHVKDMFVEFLNPLFPGENLCISVWAPNKNDISLPTVTCYELIRISDGVVAAKAKMTVDFTEAMRSNGSL